MTAKSIPAYGEVFKGYDPSTKKILHLTIGSASTNDIQVGETGVYTLVSVDLPIIVHGVWSQTATAFTTSVTETIGDSTTADLFFADTTMNIAASGAVLIRDTGTTVPYVYAAAQDLLLTVAGATAAAGLQHLYIEYSEIPA